MNGVDMDKLEEFKKMNPKVDLVQGAEMEMTIRGNVMLYKNAMGVLDRFIRGLFVKRFVMSIMARIQLVLDTERWSWRGFRSCERVRSRTNCVYNHNNEYWCNGDYCDPSRKN